MWLEKYMGNDQDAQVRDFLTFHDAKKMAEAAVAQQRYEAQMAQQAEAEAAEAEEAPAEPEGGEAPPVEHNVLPRMMPRMMGSAAIPREAPQYKYAPTGTLDPDKALDAIFGNEGGKTGKRTSLKGSAMGRYQIIDSTRDGIYRGHFANKMSKQEFEKMYRSDPTFERAVARAHMSDLIENYGTNALGAWYHPASVKAGKWDSVPNPEYGNRMTVGQYQQNAMKRYNSLQHGGWLKKYETGGEDETPKGKSAAPSGYKRRTKEQREAWNTLLDFATQKGMAGKPELDDRNQNLSRSIIDEFNTKYPDRAISPDDVQHYQYELRSINDGTFPQLVTSKPEYAEIWSQRMYNDEYNKEFINRNRSQVDNWFGSVTSTQYYPQYEFVSDKKKINYGVDYDGYAEAMYREQQKLQNIAKQKRGGKIRIR